MTFRWAHRKSQTTSRNYQWRPDHTRFCTSNCTMSHGH